MRCGSRRRITAEGNILAWDSKKCQGSAGVEEQGMQTVGPPGTWEVLSSPLNESGVGEPGISS